MKIFQVRGTVDDLHLGDEGWVFYDAKNDAICQLESKDVLKFTGSSKTMVHVWILRRNRTGTMTRKVYRLKSIRATAFNDANLSRLKISGKCAACLKHFVSVETCDDCVFD